MGRGEGRSRRRHQVHAEKRGFALPRRDQVQRGQDRDALLEQGLEGAHARVAVEAARERVALEEVGQREERHPLVMGHVRLDDHAALESPARDVALRPPAEVHRLVKAEIAQHPQLGQPLQVLHALARRHGERQEGRIGSDHDLFQLDLLFIPGTFVQPALKPQGRNAERLVLVVLVEVLVGEGGLGDAPRHTVRAAVGDLDRHRFPGGLVQKRIAVGALEQKRHQVFEHGPGPAQEHPLPADGPVGASHGEPVLQRDLAAGDGDETPQPRLAGQEIVAGAVHAVGGDVVAEQFALAVVEKGHVHPGREFPDPAGQELQRPKGLAREPLRRGVRVQHAVEPGGKRRGILWRRSSDLLEYADRLAPALGQLRQRWGYSQVLPDGA